MGLDIEDLDLPILALPVPKRPKPFNPSLIDKIFSKVTTGIEVAQKHLCRFCLKIQSQWQSILMTFGLTLIKIKSAALRTAFYQHLSGH